MSGFALLVCGLLGGYFAHDVAVRKAETAFLRAQIDGAKADRDSSEQRVKELIGSIQGVHNQLTTQVADLNDRMSASALGRGPATNPLRKPATVP